MKELNLKTVWKIPRYLPYVQPTLTDDMVREAETKIGYSLPKHYIELLKIQNGGYIRFTIPETSHSQIAGIGPYYPSITNFEWLKDYEDYVSFELDGLFPFDGNGHWNICLDYRQNETEPQVTYIDTELDYEKQIADNFKKYLSLLAIDPGDQYVIDTNALIHEIVVQISLIAKIKFEEPNNSAHGYPIYRSKFKESWLWISANKVPSAFIREGEDRYEELKFQMETTALRFPEIPENSLLINISFEPQRQELLEILTENGFKINALKTYLENNS